ncbi:MAG: transcription elongation factor NusA, partial [Actinobacteria bacterium]|nr:transcription elongation factor NusA [Actinomycetota bacterium]
MKIDLAMLRGLEREKEIPFEELAEIIEQAIHSAYIKHIVGLGQPEPKDDQVRVTLDRKNGEISVFVPELDDAGQVIGEAVVPTEEFGRIGANAAKQVINQRLRDLTDDAVLGQFKDKEGHILSGVVQQGPNPRMVHIDLGDLEAI